MRLPWLVLRVKLLFDYSYDLHLLRAVVPKLHASTACWIIQSLHCARNCSTSSLYPTRNPTGDHCHAHPLLSRWTVIYLYTSLPSPHGRWIVNSLNLHSLELLSKIRPAVTDCQVSIQCIVKIALVNIQSLSNKCFILNNFFHLKFIHIKDLTLPWWGDICLWNFSLSPRSTGCSGFLATVLHFKCRLIPIDHFLSFECPNSVLCALV